MAFKHGSIHDTISICPVFGHLTVVMLPSPMNYVYWNLFGVVGGGGGGLVKTLGLYPEDEILLAFC